MIETINKLVRTSRYIVQENGREPTPEDRVGKISGIAQDIEIDSIKKYLKTNFSKYNEMVILCAI